MTHRDLAHVLRQALSQMLTHSNASNPHYSPRQRDSSEEAEAQRNHSQEIAEEKPKTGTAVSGVCDLKRWLHPPRKSRTDTDQ